MIHGVRRTLAGRHTSPIKTERVDYRKNAGAVKPSLSNFAATSSRRCNYSICNGLIGFLVEIVIGLAEIAAQD